MEEPLPLIRHLHMPWIQVRSRAIKRYISQDKWIERHLIKVVNDQLSDLPDVNPYRTHLHSLLKRLGRIQTHASVELESVIAQLSTEEVDETLNQLVDFSDEAVVGCDSVEIRIKYFSCLPSFYCQLRGQNFVYCSC